MRNGANENQSDVAEVHRDDPANQIEVPTWLDDVVEEISAFVKESRYTDAIDLWSKAKNEIVELFEKVRDKREHDMRINCVRIYISQP